jgi:splicing factor 3A subunit 1
MNLDVIVPPDDIDALVTKTAEFVARNGSAMESKIWETQKNNPKFGFLKHGDTYRPYYEQKVFEFVEKFELEEEDELDESENEKGEEKVHEPSPFCLKHPVIAKVDMDVIKLTALFTAKNGRNFWTGLSERESKNPQFSFLKPNHALFSYFMSLVESYSRCLVPKLEDIKVLQQNLLDPESILQECLERFSCEKNLEKNQKSKEELEEEERQQMSMIDWHDFLVVETIDFADEELLPAPNDLSVVQTMSLPLNKEVETKPKVDPGVILNENYSQRCPVCRDMIPVNDFQEHVRLELMDPKFKQSRESLKGKEPSKVFASGSEVYKNLQNLAKNRPDLKSQNVEERSRAEASVTADPIMEKTKKRPADEFLPNLVSEKQWAQMHSGPVAVHIQIPSDSVNEKWNFNGQILQLSVEMRSTILEIKQQLSEILGMPVGKMKFKNITHSVMKDANTLAYYNVVPSSIIELATKERGGRRKH